MGLPENYRDQIIKLMPSGAAWAFEEGSFAFRFCYAVADELSRVHLRTLALLKERDPRSALELLPEYEKMLGLPGDCADLADNPIDRRSAIVAKIVADGGQSKKYFVDIAANAGISITIDTYPAVYIGCDIGVELTNGPWLYTWKITTDDVTVDYFQAGSNSAGDPLAEVSTQQFLECLFEDIAPAHTFIIYAFGS